MKLLVTGANGQVGSAIGRVGAAFPVEIIRLDSAALDITSVDAINSALDTFHPAFIVNAAAYTAVDKAESEPDKAELVNAIAVGHLARAAASRGIPLLHISTDYVFSGEKSEPYVEMDAVGPLGVYGHSKLRGEQLLRQYSDQYIILRTSWVFGLEGKNFPKTMLKLALDKPQLGVVADQRGCPTFADDIAKAILDVAIQYERNGQLPWGIYHYAGRGACTWYDFATVLFDSAQKEGVIKNKPDLRPLKTAEYPTAAMRPANSVLDCRKFMAAFPAIALSDWQEGIHALVAASRL